MKKFEEGDIFKNNIKAYPKIKFFGYNGQIYNNSTAETEIKLNNFLQLPSGQVVALDNILLSEDGDFLITESGDYILIE